MNNCRVTDSSDSKNFVQGVPISLWKNLGHFSLFRDVLVNIGRDSRFGWHEVCALKKKMFLKPKQICILYTEKRKKNEKKRNKQRYLYNKL